MKRRVRGGGGERGAISFRCSLLLTFSPSPQSRPVSPPHRFFFSSVRGALLLPPCLVFFLAPHAPFPTQPRPFFYVAHYLNVKLNIN